MSAQDPNPGTGSRAAEWFRLQAVNLVIWTALAVILGLQTYSNLAGSPLRQPLGLTIWFSVVRYWVYAALTPFVWWLAKRSPPMRRQKVRLMVMLAAGFVVYHLGYVVLRELTYPSRSLPSGATPLRTLASFVELGQASLFEHVWMYGSVLAVGIAVFYYRESQLREVREARLKSQVSEYELQILKLQLHPHFLFNTLNGISTLMATDTQTAQEMILRLSDLLRVALSHSSAREISLREEMEFIETYLQLEQMRFGPRLQVRFAIAPETLDAQLPNMILQPLVENAVRHGIAKQREKGAIEVVSSRQNATLRITVENDGPALNADTPSSSRVGLGLANTRSRLLQLYPESSLKISNRLQGGVQVCLEIPFHEAEASPNDESYLVHHR